MTLPDSPRSNFLTVDDSVKDVEFTIVALLLRCLSLTTSFPPNVGVAMVG